MVNRPNAAQAASSGQAERRGQRTGRRLAGEHVDDAAEQHRFGELRAGQQQIGDGKDPAQPRLLAEQLEDAGVKAKQGHAVRDSTGGRRGGRSSGSCILIRDRPRDTAARSIFCSIDQAAVQRRQESVVEDIRRPTAACRNLKSSAIWSIDRSRRAGSMPPMPLRFTSPVRMLSRSDGAQPFEFEIARSAVHPVDDFIRRAPGILDGRDAVPAITARRKPFTASGLAAANAGLTMTAKP